MRASAGFDDTGDVAEDDLVAIDVPLLGSKMLNVDMASARHRMTIIDHQNYCFIAQLAARLQVVDIMEDRVR